MEGYKLGSHVLLFDLNNSQPASSFLVGRPSLCSDQEDENKVKLHMDKSKVDQVQEDSLPQVDDRDDDQDEAAYKWMPSKMRILRKMMSSCQESSYHKKFPLTTTNHEYTNSSRRATYNDTTDDSARVCADCNTTKTPLWRSGPRGPKSLCNACGIRQRKARRAMAAAAAAASGTNFGVSAPAASPLKIKKLKHKKKKKKERSKGVDDHKLKKTEKEASPKKECVGLEDLTSRVVLSSNYYNPKVFPQDEKEAAILLMALSYPTEDRLINYISKFD